MSDLRLFQRIGKSFRLALSAAALPRTSALVPGLISLDCPFPIFVLVYSSSSMASDNSQQDTCTGCMMAWLYARAIIAKLSILQLYGLGQGYSELSSADRSSSTSLSAIFHNWGLYIHLDVQHFCSKLMSRLLWSIIQLSGVFLPCIWQRVFPLIWFIIN